MHEMRNLHLIKLLHTMVWAFFVACILALPIFAAAGEFRFAFALMVVVGLEVFVLLLNGLKCPLTDVAARYTEERQDNFDIYLPLYLARYNKHIFGALYVAGTIYTLALWHGARFD
ncbi:MAG: hypothetical protein U1F35_18995 [Steroidobacteraceae bacterium]